MLAVSVIERESNLRIDVLLQEAKLSKFMDYNIYLKCENLQYTGRYMNT